MEMRQKKDFESPPTSCLQAGTTDDVKSKNSSNEVIEGMANYDKITKEDFDITESQRLDTRTDHSNTHESTKCEPSFIEEIVNHCTVCFSYKPLQFLRRRYGLALAFLAPLFFSIESLCIKILTETLDAFQVVFMHVPVLMLFSLVLIIYAGIRPSKDYKHYLWLLGSGSCQASTVCFISLSMSYLAASDTVTIIRTSVIQVAFFSWLILKEPLRLFDILFALLALVGVVFIARPPFIFRNYTESSSTYDATLLGVLFALAGSATIALLYVFNRKLSKVGVNSLFCIFFNATATVLLSGLVSVILNRWRCPAMLEWFFALLAGVAYAFAQFTVFYALKVETATLVTVMCTMQLFWTFLLQIVFLHLLPFWTSYIGTILIIAACIGITVKNKQLPSAPDTAEDMEGNLCKAI